LDAYEAVRTRIEVREFLPREVPRELQLKVVDSGRMAPSAWNRQAWHFVLIDDRKLLADLAAVSESGRYIKGAPFAIATLIEKSYPQYSMDSIRCVHGMMIAAWGMGLGSCYVGSIDREKAKELLKAPAELHLVTITPFGYPSKPLRGKKTRKALEEVASLNQFGNKIR
jgi:nitroreductase